MPALSITEHGNVFGWLDFYDACREAEIKPILGIEAYQARKTKADRDEEERAGRANDELLQRGPYHLTLLARNLTGYRNIIRLSSAAYLDGFYVKPRIDHELLAQHSEGVTILSGCLNGEVQQALLRGDYGFALKSASILQDIVGPDNFFVEIQDHGLVEQAQVRDQLLQLAGSLHAPVVPTGDSHYVLQGDAHAHDVMLCVSTNATLDQEERFKFAGPHFHLQSYEEMAQKFPDEWLTTSLAIAESVELELPFGELQFPEYPLPEGETLDGYLDKLVWEGIRERYGASPRREVLDRTEHELRVIKKMGFQSYFLVVWDLVKWARDNGVRVGWGRGSAAGCIVSYALRITSLDPLRFGLLFERFLVEGRKSMPDIDLDFDDRYRDRVVDYARSKYGNDRVTHIITFSTVGARAAVRDAARVLGYEYSMGDKIAKLVPPPVLGVSPSIQQALETADLQDLYRSDEDVQRILDAAKGLEGLVRQTSVHAAGVIIAPAPAVEFIPLQRTYKKGVPGPVTTQWDMYGVERARLLKIDFLALRNLAIIDLCVENIKKTQGFELDIESIPLNDALTYEQLRAGNTMGSFQLESSGMREMTMAIRPERIEDIMAVISLFRPGALGSGADRLYIGRKNGRIPVEYDHPALEDVLKSTYGVMLYQEDVLAVAGHLAGFTTGEADDLRKAIGKKEMDKIGKFRDMFVEGCRKTHDVPESVANKIYSDIEYFGGYGFNRAHGASYAMVSYVTAYLKFHYPVEYMAALLTTIDEKKKMAPYLNEARRMGLKVLPPSINESEPAFKVESQEEILFGLSSIDGVGPAVVDAILRGRKEPYVSLHDFMRRCDPDVLNKGTLEHLIRSGAFDELVPDQPEVQLTRAEKLEFLEMEKKELGLYVSDHPLLGVAHYLESVVTTSIHDLELREAGETVVIAGLLTTVVNRTTKKGEKMFNLTLEDLTGSVEILVFPKKAATASFTESSFLIVEGRVQKEGDDEAPISKIFYSDSCVPNIPEHGMGEPIVLHFAEPPSDGIIRGLEQLIEENPGDSPVYIEFDKGPHIVSLKFKKPTTIDIKHSLELYTLGERLNVV